MKKQIFILMTGAAIIATSPVFAMNEETEGSSIPCRHPSDAVNASEDWTTDPTNPAYIQTISAPEAWTDPAHEGYIILSRTNPTHPGYIAAPAQDGTN